MNGVYFDDIHSFYDLGLILSDCSIESASPKTNFIDIPFGNGSLDLTEAQGEVCYNDRKCKFTFSVLPCNFEEKKTEVSNALNGLRCKISLDKDSEYYYIGRCSVDEQSCSKRIGKIAVSAICHPYKFKQHETIRSFKLTGGEREVTIENGRLTVVPTIECDNDNMMFRFNGKNGILRKGFQQSVLIKFRYGINKLILSGEGTIRFIYQEGDL